MPSCPLPCPSPQVAMKSSFFIDHCGLFSLDNRSNTITPWCINFIAQQPVRQGEGRARVVGADAVLQTHTGTPTPAQPRATQALPHLHSREPHRHSHTCTAERHTHSHTGTAERHTRTPTPAQPRDTQALPHRHSQETHTHSHTAQPRATQFDTASRQAHRPLPRHASHRPTGPFRIHRVIALPTSTTDLHAA